MTTENKPTYEELKAKAIAALQAGNDAEYWTINNQMKSFKAEIAKAEQEAFQKKQEALASDRAKLSAKILAIIEKAVSPDNLKAVEATGFTFYMPDDTSDKARVGLAVPQLKKVRVGGTGGGGAGLTSEKVYGMKLDDIYAKYATAEDKAKMEAPSLTNTQKWAIKKAVRDNAVEQGFITNLQ